MKVHLDLTVIQLKGFKALVSPVSSLLIMPGHCCLMGLVRGIFGIWVVCDSPTGEPGIAGAGDSSSGLWGESNSGSVGDSSLGLWGESVISACW